MICIHVGSIFNGHVNCGMLQSSFVIMVSGALGKIKTLALKKIAGRPRKASSKLRSLPLGTVRKIQQKVGKYTYKKYKVSFRRQQFLYNNQAVANQKLRELRSEWHDQPRRNPGAPKKVRPIYVSGDESVSIAGLSVTGWNARSKYYRQGVLTRDGTKDASIIDEIFVKYNRKYGRHEWKVAPGDQICDLGSHVGGFMMACMNRGASKYVGIELCPQNFDILYRNAVLAQKQEDRSADREVVLINAAIGGLRQSGGKTQIVARAVRRVHGEPPVIDTARTRTQDYAGRKDEVVGWASVVSIQAFNSKFGHFCLLKADVEGSEQKAFHKAAAYLPPYVVLEYHRKEAGLKHGGGKVGETRAWNDMYRELRSAGFHIEHSSPHPWADGLVYCWRSLRDDEKTCPSCVAREALRQQRRRGD